MFEYISALLRGNIASKYTMLNKNNTEIHEGKLLLKRGGT